MFVLCVEHGQERKKKKVAVLYLFIFIDYQLNNGGKINILNKNMFYWCFVNKHALSQGSMVILLSTTDSHINVCSSSLSQRNRHLHFANNLQLYQPRCHKMHTTLYVLNGWRTQQIRYINGINYSHYKLLCKSGYSK